MAETGSTNARVEATAKNLRDLSASQLRQVAKESGVHVGTKMPKGQIVAAITNRIYMARRDGAKVATASELYGPDVPKDQVRQAAASSEAKQAEKINSAIEKVKAASPAKRAAASAKASRGGAAARTDRIGAPGGPKLKDVVRPGPGQPVGTLTQQQKLALTKGYGFGGALVASQMPTHPANAPVPATPKPSPAPQRPAGMSARGKIGLALSAAAAAAALYGAMRVGSGKAPASSAPPADSGKTRTAPYTDSLGRRYENGRLIIRDK